MRKTIYSLLLILGLTCFVACRGTDPWDDPVGGEEEVYNPLPSTAPSDKYGITYLYDGGVLPELHLEIPLDQWNSPLSSYDADKNTKTQIHCDAIYVKGTERTRVENAGLRLRGVATRKRPEGKAGQMHSAGDTDWNRCHFQVNFRKFVKDDAHTVHGARKILLRWNHADPAYVREVYSYDLYRRSGVAAGANAAHCRLYLHVAGDPEEIYYGIYTMVEPIDETFVKIRKEAFGSDKGNLWKCRHKATLATDDSFSDIGEDNDEGREYTYELKTNIGELDLARAQLENFVHNLNALDGQAFHDWIARVCDVRLLLRTYAVNVALGMWDDYWNNMNNYYIYFNSKDSIDYRFFFVPFDYDNSLGNCATRNSNEDQGRHNPFEWGPRTRPLIWKIIQFEDYRKIYAEELLRLVNPSHDLMYYIYSISRVKDWQARIRDYIVNDTGEDTKMEDRPTIGSTHREYKLAVDNEYNFFKVKMDAIHLYCDSYVK